MRRALPVLLVVVLAAGLWFLLRSDGGSSAVEDLTREESEVAGLDPVLLGRGGEQETPRGEQDEEETPEVEGPEVGRIVGRVVGPDGLPVEGATGGYRTHWYGDPDDVLADADGRFTLELTDDVEVTVVATAPGYQLAIGAHVKPRAGEMRDVGTLVLAKGSSIRGRIENEEGQPAAGIEVGIRTEADPQPESWEAMWLANEDWWNQYTADDGSFVFEKLPEGRYRVMMSRGEDARWDEVREHVPTGTDDLLFVVEGEFQSVDVSLEVLAEGPNGEPVAGFQAALQSMDGVGCSGTAANNPLAMDVEAARPPVRLVVWNPRDADGKPLNFGPGVLSNVVSREEPYVVRLAPPAGVVAGRVSWSGEPRPWALMLTIQCPPEEAAVGVEPDPDPPLLHFNTQSELDGTFRFVGLPPGEATVGFPYGTTRGGKLKGGRVVAAVGREDLVLEVVPTGRLKLLFLPPEGLQIGWAAVRIEQHVKGGLASVQTGTTGGGRGRDSLDYTCEGLDTDSRFRVSMTGVCGGRQYAETVLDGIRPREEPYELRLQEGLSISGRVVRGDGSPVAGAAVHFRRWPGGVFADWTWGFGAPRTWFAGADDDGRFTLTGLEPGKFVLEVDGVGLTVRPDTQWVDAGARGVRLVVRPLQTISGRLIDPDREDLDDFWVYGVPAEGEPHIWTPDPPAADGSFEVEGLGPGRWRIVAWNRGEETDPRYVLSESVPAGARDLRLAVKQGTALAGAVRTADGEPVPSARVNLRGPWTNRIERTDREGHYAFAGVPPGSYEVLVLPPIGTGTSTTVRTTDGGTQQTLDIAMPGP